MKCRFCKSNLEYVFIDLGMSPLANSYLKVEKLKEMEPYYPLRAFVCNQCFLVQLDEFKTPVEIFSDYAYFSSYSKTWLSHTEEYVNILVDRFKLNQKNLVVEIASNDGYLLQFFKKKNFPILGIEPASNVAKVAVQKGIPTINKFFGVKVAKELAKSGRRPKLLIANNVLPHVSNLSDFLNGLKILLSNDGFLAVQFSAYLLSLIKYGQFDHIYHEHFSCFSFYTIQKIFSHFGLTVFDVEELPIHGGSLRLYVKHSENNDKALSIKQSVRKQIKKEERFGITKISTYMDFPKKVALKKASIRDFFVKAKAMRKKIVGYGAPAKGNTLLNFCGINSDFIDYTVDINPYKQGKFLPGSHIPIYSPEKVFETKPDYLIILPWNLKNEIIEQMEDIKKWDGKFVTLIPKVKIYP